MVPLLTAAEMRTLDERTIGEVGLPGAVLMETAGRAVFGHLWAGYAERARSGPTAVVCGRGNNGGDGFVVARCLANAGCRVRSILLGRREDVGGDAAVHLGAYLGGGGELLEVTGETAAEAALAVAGASLLVDAVVGTGLSQDLRGLPALAVGWLNASPAPVVSVDLPSGVDSDTGRLCGAAVAADLTVTFAWAKRGHLLHPGAALCGRLEVADIGIPPGLLDAAPPGLFALEPADFAGRLARPRDAHKGTFGHVLTLGGSVGKEGAAVLTAHGALRCGAGLSTLAWPAGLFGAAGGRVPAELMAVPLGAAGALAQEWSGALWGEASSLQAGADAVVAGPGLGMGEGASSFLERLLASAGPPLVLDADALNLVAAAPGLWRPGARAAVLTPHPGEAARLLGTSAAAVQADRPAAVRELAARTGAVVVLKGARTLVTGPGEPIFLVPAGNPGMATAGSGDVLSGGVAALLARGLPPLDAARLAAYAHALAGDLAAAELGEDGLTAAELLAWLPRAVRRLAQATDSIDRIDRLRPHPPLTTDQPP